MVSVANRLAVVASRMVEVIGANGIYSSPIVKTTLINAWLRKKQVLPAAIVLKQNLYSGIGTQSSGGRFRKAGQTRTFLGAFGFADCSVSRPSFDQRVQDRSQVSVETV
ncbi:MAG: hypothetical protein DMG78_25540 [Acidobacteria bacterium]|nr:MAG: hypothetical protein DMG78_25540 [Acidobacteriota bacterium]